MSETSCGSLIALVPLCLVGVFGLVVLVVLANAVRIVPEYKRLSVFRLGRYIGHKGPGIVFLRPFIDSAEVVDMRDPLAQIEAQPNLQSALGETRTLVHTEGTIEISGKIWSAVSKQPIPSGAKVRVARVVLEVERS